MIKIGIIGNCSGKGLERSIAKMVPDSEILLINVGEILESDMKQLDYWAESLSKCHFVMTLPIYGERWGALDSHKISSICQTIIIYPYPAFTGFHPDCGFIFRDGDTISMPGYEYSSSIIAGCYLAGLQSQRVAKLFNAYTYSMLSYFAEFNAAKEEFLKIANGHGFDLDPIFNNNTVFMHTINHPCINVIHMIAKQSLERVGIKHSNTDLPIDDLSYGQIWPIYPEIGSKLKIESNNFLFSKHNSLVTLDEYIFDSYTYFDSLTHDFSSSSVKRAKEYVRAEVKF